jgi:hypothetical protein
VADSQQNSPGGSLRHAPYGDFCVDMATGHRRADGSVAGDVPRPIGNEVGDVPHEPERHPGTSQVQVKQIKPGVEGHRADQVVATRRWRAV